VRGVGGSFDVSFGLTVLGRGHAGVKSTVGAVNNEVLNINYRKMMQIWGLFLLSYYYSVTGK